MRSKRSVLATIIAMFVLTGITTVNLYSDSITDFNTAREFQGTATPLIQCNLLSGFNDDWRGMITKTVYPGTIFHGPTKDINGKVIDPGTILFTIDKKGRQVLVDQYVAQLDIAKENYIRDKKLIPSNSISKQQLQQDEAAYFAAKAEVAQQTYLLDLCTIRAKFDGVVIKILNVGWLSGEPPVMEIAQLTPMGISVKMDRTLANKIKPTTPVYIYPDPSISSKVFGISRGNSILTDDGITFAVNNFQALKNVVNGKKVPVVTYASPIISFNDAESDSVLSVENACIFKDDKGTFVWLAVGQKNLEGKGFDEVFPLKKVYIELAGLATFGQIFNEYNAIKPNPELKVNDTIIKDVPEGFKDGDEVSFQDMRFIFMPGDKVRVVIGPAK